MQIDGLYESAVDNCDVRPHPHRNCPERPQPAARAHSKYPSKPLTIGRGEQAPGVLQIASCQQRLDCGWQKLPPLARIDSYWRIINMPTRNVNLTEHFDRFIAARIKAGRFS